MFKQETIDAMWEHFSHAKEKHPFFAERVTELMPPNNGDILGALLGMRVIESWERLAQGCKSEIKRMPSAENVLNAELAEIFLAVVKGDLKQAHYEIFDAIAVLLRLDEEMEKILGVEVAK